MTNLIKVLQFIQPIKEYMRQNNIVRRNEEDRSVHKKSVHIFGELSVYQYLSGEIPNLHEMERGPGFNHVIAFSGKKIEVVTIEKLGWNTTSFGSKFYVSKEVEHADFVFFCIYHNFKLSIEICGFLPVSDLPKVGYFLPAGTVRMRNNGSTYQIYQDCYEVEKSALNDMSKLKSLCLSS